MGKKITESAMTVEKAKITVQFFFKGSMQESKNETPQNS